MCINWIQGCCSTNFGTALVRLLSCLQDVIASALPFFSRRTEIRTINGGQTQEAQSQGVSPPASSSSHQPQEALRSARQQKRHLLPRPAAAPLSQEQKQVQKVDRRSGTAKGGVHGCCSSTQNHQVSNFGACSVKLLTGGLIWDVCLQDLTGRNPGPHSRQGPAKLSSRPPCSTLSLQTFRM